MNANYDAHPELAELYDHVPLYRDRKDVGFYVDLCRAAKGEILELGCGTGRILIPLEHLLVRSGFQVESFFGNFDKSAFTDSSPEMIVVAVRKD